MTIARQYRGRGLPQDLVSEGVFGLMAGRRDGARPLHRVGGASSARPGLPFVSGAFAIHTARSITDWARLDVVACGADPLTSAKSTVEATAAQIAVILPAERATQVIHHLTGGGGAVVKLTEAEEFLAQGQSCPAAGKAGAAGDKVEAASNQLAGFPVCPGGARCVPLLARDQSLALLSLARLAVAGAQASTCAGEPSCGSCQGP